MKGAAILFLSLVAIASASPLATYLKNPILGRYIVIPFYNGTLQLADITERPQVKADVNEVFLYLFTQQNRNGVMLKMADFSELQNSGVYQSGKNNVFIFHGWNNDHTSSVNTMITAAMLDTQDVNVFVVDWGTYTHGQYSTAVAAVPEIGQFTGSYISQMMNAFGLGGSNFRFVGHSLGAHVAGCTGAASPQKVESIVGLDAAGPFFTVDDTSNRLDPGDAKFVQALHTNDNFLGFSDSLGSVDMRPNGGGVQPGCGADLTGVCSHGRAYEFFAESVRSQGFSTRQCGSYDDYAAGNCNSNQGSHFGRYQPDTGASGNHFFSVAENSPYSQG